MCPDQISPKGFKSKLFTLLSTSFSHINRTDAVIMIFPNYMVDRIQKLMQGYPHLYSLALKFQRIRNLLTLHNLELQLSPLVDHQLNHIYYLLNRSLKYKKIHAVTLLTPVKRKPWKVVPFCLHTITKQSKPQEILQIFCH